jgi:hypothetical protein
VSNLNERRAVFVYEGARLAARAAGAPIIPEPWEEREGPFREQFLDVIERQMGEQRSRSPEELHGSWMQAYFLLGWQLERDKDAVFVALCEIARQWIYDLEPGDD